MEEVGRVLRSGSGVVLTTPNRFSLTPELHVFVWGVGWLPRRLQAGYVRWRSGKSYDHTRLFSSWGLAGLIRLYARLAGLPPLRPLFLICGPLFRVQARKP